MKLNDELENIDEEGNSNCSYSEEEESIHTIHTEREIRKNVPASTAQKFIFDFDESSFNSEMIKNIFGRQLVSIKLTKFNNNLSFIYNSLCSKSEFQIHILLGKNENKAFIVELTL